MMGRDPIADALSNSFRKAMQRIRPKARSASTSGTGFFGSSVSISISKNTRIKPKRTSGYVEDDEDVEIVWKVVLPDSDRAKSLSRKEKQDKKRRRKASKAAKRKNRKRR